VKPSFQEDSGIPGYHQIENDNLLEEVLQLCHRLSKKPPASERIKKELLKRSTAANIEDARTVEFKNFTRRMISR
jgi:enoyl-CoA hydratase/carnithine racemase